jgi:hypothetical protein
MSSWRSNLTLVALVLAAGATVNRARQPLNAAFLATKVRDDVFALPPPGQLVAMSLGYRSALADLIFAHVLVSSGIHFQEKRTYEVVGKYIQAINALDPKFEMPYRMADGLITLQAKPVSVDSYRQARRILERGLAEFPFSQALWASAGQFLAYLGPTGGIVEPQELADWQLAGGRTLARACELVGSNEAPPRQCIGAAGVLTQAGASLASRQFIERMLFLNDDPKVRAFMSGLLEKSIGAEERDRLQAHREGFQRAWGADLPFVTRGALLTIGPRWDSARCASPESGCPTSWRAWAAAQEEGQSATNAFSDTVGASR